MRIDMRMRKGGYGGGKQAAGPRGRGHGRDRDERINQRSKERAKERSNPRQSDLREKRVGDGAGRKRHTSVRHPEVRAQRASKGDGPGRSSFEGGLRPPSQDHGIKPANYSAGVQTVTVTPDENGMRVDRFFEARFPGLSFSHIQRIIRKGEVRVNGKRTQPKNRLEAGPGGAHSAAQARGAETARRRAAGAEGPRLHQVDHALRRRRRAGAQQADGPCRAGRLRHQPAYRRHARRAARAGRRRPAPAPGAPARQGHRRLPAGGQDPLCGRRAGEDLPHPLGAQDLLGAGGGRAEAETGPRLDLPGQAGAGRGFLHAHRQARREGRGARRDLLRGGGNRGAEARLDFAQAGDRPHPSIARPHGACRQPDHRRSEIFQHRELGAAGRHAEQTASAGAAHCGAASARRHHRRERAAAAAYGAVLEPARLRRQALRPDRRGAGGGVAAGRRHAYVIVMGYRRPLLVLLVLALSLPAMPARAQSDNYPYSIMRPEPGTQPVRQHAVPKHTPPHRIVKRAQKHKTVRGSSNPVYPTRLPAPAKI